MGLKKYEIITVGSDKRVRALRSWAVGDRYVNIGDVGGIVYDEKTLSQDGLCWLFRGNFGFSGARIGGDSIVDVAEATLPVKGTPNVDILGASVVVGSKLVFEAEKTAADAVVLTADDFEQGGFNAPIAGNPLTGSDSPTYIRTKNPIFAGGKTVTLKCEVPGYSVQAFALDRDGLVITSTQATATGVGVTMAVPAGQYFVLALRKDPVAATVPADAADVQITFTGTYETSLSIIDSRLEINPATSTGTTLFKAGGTYSFSSGAKYPETIIRNSKVSVNVPAVVSREFRLMGQIIGSTAVLDATAGPVTIAGIYSNIKNLTALGIAFASVDVAAYNIIQAHDCDNFVVSPTVFPGLADAQTAKVPFIFQGCNVPNGRFYHHVQIANTYKNIDFAKAQADLGKSIAGGRILASAEVEGMYRLSTGTGGLMGSLVESHDSVAKLVFSNFATIYGTTIYKDAYISGKFDIAGTNVFGNKVRSHPLAQVLNVQPRAVQGNLALTVGQRPALVPGSLARVVIDRPIRINTAKGITVSNIPAGIQAAFACVDGQGNFVILSSWQEGTATVINLVQLDLPAAYVMFKKANDTTITTEELAGVTVTVYNGCKIVNTGATAVNMKGNIRVEDNATLVNADITGTGYFGGNAVMSGVTINGCVYMRDNASIIKTAGSGIIRNLKMTENTYAVLGDFALSRRIHLSDNAKFTPTGAGLSEGDLVMEDNAVISGAIIVGGMLTMKDNAKVSAGTLSAYGDITLRGGYVSTVNKTFTGKRVIDNDSAPAYSNNVKTQYDF
jgi:hypothetical protein|nr:MAG TPA: Putative transferase, nesg, ydcK, Structural Genomics.38A [Caudoviricetes sp.]